MDEETRQAIRERVAAPLWGDEPQPKGGAASAAEALAYAAEFRVRDGRYVEAEALIASAEIVALVAMALEASDYEQARRVATAALEAATDQI